MGVAKLYLFGVMILFGIGFCLAGSVDANYQIVGNKVLAEIGFGDVSGFEFDIPYDAKAIDVNSDYELVDRKIMISSAEDLKIKFISESFIEKSGGEYFFILNKGFVETSKVIVYLPEGAVLSEPEFIFPKNAVKSTDGRRVILTWNAFNEEQVLVKYEFIEENNFVFYAVVVILVIILIISYSAQKRKYKKSLKEVKEKTVNKIDKKESLTKNLFEDEKKIVEYLLKKKGHESWTKDIVKDVGISKVKLSRKLRSLVQKEIVKKIPYGNENKIRLR